MKQALGHLPSYSNAVVMLPLYPVAYQIQREADVGEPLNVLLKKNSHSVLQGQEEQHSSVTLTVCM